MAMSRRDAGRLGGIQKYLRHGTEAMRNAGRLGGRPRLKRLSERQQQAPQAQIQIKEGGLPTRLSELKGLYKLQIKKGRSCSALEVESASPGRRTVET